jgi:hypothetical protein
MRHPAAVPTNDASFDEVRVHRSALPKQCPGDPLPLFAKSLDGRGAELPVKDWQQHRHAVLL